MVSCYIFIVMNATIMRRARTRAQFLSAQKSSISRKTMMNGVHTPATSTTLTAADGHMNAERRYSFDNSFGSNNNNSRRNSAAVDVDSSGIPLNNDKEYECSNIFNCKYTLSWCSNCLANNSNDVVPLDSSRNPSSCSVDSAHNSYNNNGIELSSSSPIAVPTVMKLNPSSTPSTNTPGMAMLNAPPANNKRRASAFNHLSAQTIARYQFVNLFIVLFCMYHHI